MHLPSSGPVDKIKAIGYVGNPDNYISIRKIQGYCRRNDFSGARDASASAYFTNIS